MSKHTGKQNTGKKKTTLLIALLLLLLLALVVFAVWFFLLREEKIYDDRLEPNAVVGTMPGKTTEQIEAELTQKVKETEVAFSINAYPCFETGTSKGSILFENPKSNQKLTRVEITRDDTGELIYKSGLLEPGSYIPEAKLLVDLDPGNYVCTATIFAYRLADESYVGKVAAGLTLTVES